MTPAAVLSILVKTTGSQAAMAQLAKVDAAAKATAGSTDKMAAAQSRGHSSFDKTAKAAGVAAVGVGLLGAAAVKSAANYEQSMNVLQAQSHASGAEMKKLSALAVKLGADVHLPGTSAQDAAEAMTEMIKSGVSLKDTMAGVRSTLVLSAAAGVSNADAAEMASNALNTFKLKGKDVALVADELANTANASSVEIRDVADAMKMAGAVFSGFQGPVLGAKGAMHELNVAIGLLGNAGIKGSDAGTSLKQTLLQLTGPSDKAKAAMRALYLNARGASTAEGELTGVIRGTGKERQAALKSMEGHNKALQKGGDIAYDASGKMRSLKDIIALTAKGTRGMTQEQKNAYLTQIYGADATRTVIALMNSGQKGWDKMSGAVSRQGAAQDLANAKMKGFKGAVESLKSTLQTLAITLGTPILQPLASLVRGFASFLSTVSPTAIGVLVGGLGAVAAATWAVNAAMAANPATLIAAGLVALTAALIVAYQKSEAFRNIVNGAFAAVKTGAMAAVGAVKQVPALFSTVTNAITTEIGKWKVVAWALNAIKALFAPAFIAITAATRIGLIPVLAIFRTTWGVAKAIFAGAFTALKGIVSGGLQAMHGVIQIIGGIFKGDFKQIWEGVKNVFGGALKAILGLLKGQLQTLVGAGKAIGEGIAGAITGAFGAAVGTVRGFINSIIGIVNSVLGFLHLGKIPTIGGGNSAKTPSRRNPAGDRAGGQTGLARGGAFARTGGMVDQPITLMGEEAPRHPEFVIPTNPAYRKRAQGLLAQAAGAVGFADGGIWGVANKIAKGVQVLTNPVGSLAGAVAGGTRTAGSFIKNLPGTDGLPSWLRGVGGYTLDKVKKWIKDKVGLGGGIGKGAAGSVRGAMALAQSLGLAITSTTGGKHATNSWHYKGRAADVAGAPAAMAQFFRAAYKRYGSHLLELFYDPIGWYVKNGQKVPGAIGGHSDHVHVALKKGGKHGKGPMARASSTVGISGKLSPRARKFAASLATQTGLDPNVIAAWIFSEEGGRRSPVGHNDNNWLNVGWTDSGPSSATRLDWSDPERAAKMTANWMKGGGQISKVWGKAPGGIQRILNSAGKGPSAQIAAISGSGWASNSYGGGLAKVYRQIKASKKVKTKTKGKGKSNGRMFGEGMRSVGKGAGATATAAAWAKLAALDDDYQRMWMIASTTPSLVDDLTSSARGIKFWDSMVAKATSYLKAGVPGAAQMFQDTTGKRDEWVSRYTDTRDSHPGLSPSVVAPIWRGPAEAAYARSRSDSTGSTGEQSPLVDYGAQIAEELRLMRLRGEAVQGQEPLQLVANYLAELASGRLGSSATMIGQGPSTPGVVAAGYSR